MSNVHGGRKMQVFEHLVGSIANGSDAKKQKQSKDSSRQNARYHPTLLHLTQEVRKLTRVLACIQTRIVATRATVRWQ